MNTTSKLVVNVVELLENPGTLKRLEFSEALEGLSLELARIPADQELSFDLTLESIEGGILVRGPIRGRYIATCRRCLGEATQAIEFDTAEVYRLPGEAWEEGYVIDGERIDLRGMVRDNVLLNLPLHPVCREDCRGLCPRCGANLNDGPCGCPPDDVDLRWAALRDLLKDQ